MLFAAIWLFTFSTFDLVLGLQINISAFVSSDDPAAAFANSSNWVNVMKFVTYVAQTFMADCILLYRFWIIYEKNWKVMFVPLLMWIAETVCGAIASSIDATTHNPPNTAPSLAPSLAPFTISMIALTLATNVIVTSLMVFRIWSIQKEIRQLTMRREYTSPAITRAILVLVESGAIYTTVVLIMLCTYVTSNAAAYIVSDCLIQIIGIVFNLILIKVARGTAVRPVEVNSHPNVDLPFVVKTQISAIDFRCTTASDAEMGEGGTEMMQSKSSPK